MKRFLESIFDRINDFLVYRSQPKPMEPATREEIQEYLELAIQKKAAIHVIYGERSFTGDIVKYDKERQRLIMKNFKRRVTSIIRIDEIKKISLVPENIKKSQLSKGWISPAFFLCTNSNSLAVLLIEIDEPWLAGADHIAWIDFTV